MNEGSRKESATWDILGFGAVAVDDLIYLDSFPHPDSKVRVLHRERHGGGLCASALVASARLGSSCAYAGVLGHDELSRFSLDELRREGVDVSQVLVDDEARPAHSTIMVESEHKTRTILSDRSGVKPYPLRERPSGLFRRAKVVFLDHTSDEHGRHITILARAQRKPTVADVERVTEHLGEWINDVDHLIVGEKFAREWTERSSIEEAVRELGQARDVAVITLGERGCIACGRAMRMQVLRVPAFPIKVLDTTGCGDAFHGAYTSELARGSDVITRLKIASAVAAIKAKHRGGRGGLPNREEALKLVHGA